MKNYYVKAVKTFTDLEENELRVAGESKFYCTKERYEKFMEKEAVELIEIKEDKKTKKEEIIEEIKVEKPIKKQNKNKNKK